MIISHCRSYYEFISWQSEELPVAMKKFLSIVEAKEGDGSDSPEVSDDYSSDNSDSDADSGCPVS